MKAENSIISEKAKIGSSTKIWHFVQIREGAVIGDNCIISKGAYIDFDVKIGNNVKIQNNASIYHGSTIEDGVFIGPHACLTNDKNPRAVNPDGSLKSASDWEVSPIHIKKGASIGAGAIVLPGAKVGEFALVGAGAIVTKNIPDYAIVLGNPAKLIGYTCKCAKTRALPDAKKIECPHCKTSVKVI